MVLRRNQSPFGKSDFPTHQNRPSSAERLFYFVKFFIPKGLKRAGSRRCQWQMKAGAGPMRQRVQETVKFSARLCRIAGSESPLEMEQGLLESK